MEKKYVNIGAETLAYLDEGQGEVVLMIHGNMSSSALYQFTVKMTIKDYCKNMSITRSLIHSQISTP